MKYIIERKGGWYVTSYSKDKENEQNISSSRALSRALRFSEKEDAKAMAVLVNGKVIEVKEWEFL